MLHAALGSDYRVSGEYACKMAKEKFTTLKFDENERTTRFNGGCMLASGRENGTIVLWRKDRQTPVSTLSGHTGVVNDVCWAPNIPKLLVSASDDRTIRFWY